MAPPALLLTYRAMQSIFSAVSDEAEAQLHARWISLKHDLGLPRDIEQRSPQKGAAFAEAGLGSPP